MSNKVLPYNPDISNCVRTHSCEWLSTDVKLALGLAKYDRKKNYTITDCSSSLIQQHKKNKLRLTLDFNQDCAGNFIPFVKEDCQSPRNISS